MTQTADVPAAAAPTEIVGDVNQDSINAIIGLIGNLENIDEVMACATNRLRFKLKSPIEVAPELAAEIEDVRGVMHPSENIVHFLLKEDASPWAAAIKSNISAG
ncbi:PTS transporter subunit EIIB [Echinimonas agarilytica]|uniref:PTS transporter subunit EIIB n=1 Tax=Echinimonas agarilytica TaxID=1215918 RepID=A0AA41W4G2_9GAMM|nr:PTS transporter subunit EIIB [Echinimonas agarilytica]